MHIYVYIYVYLYVCIYISIFTYIYIYVYLYIYRVVRDSYERVHDAMIYVRALFLCVLSLTFTVSNLARNSFC